MAQSMYYYMGVKTINMLRVTGNPAEVLAIRLRKLTKSVPYSCDDYDYDDVSANNNYNNKTKVIPVLTGTISKLFKNT